MRIFFISTIIVMSLLNTVNAADANLACEYRGQQFDPISDNILFKIKRDIFITDGKEYERTLGDKTFEELEAWAYKITA